MTVQTTIFDTPTETATADYHNTNGCKGAELKANKEKAKAQNAKILHIYKTYSSSKLSPNEIKRRYPGQICLNSVRRAITDLASTTDKQGAPRIPDLLKTSERIPTPDGGMEYRWTLNTAKFYQ